MSYGLSQHALSLDQQMTAMQGTRCCRSMAPALVAQAQIGARMTSASVLLTGGQHSVGKLLPAALRRALDRGHF